MVTKVPVITLFILILFNVSSFSQEISGVWYAGGNYQNEITIWQADNGLYYGKISKVLNPANKHATCHKCKGVQKGHPYSGLITIDGLHKKGNEYVGGTSLDPKSGKTYKCKVWLDEEGNLKIRGYLGFLYGTETLTPVKS